MEARLIMMYLKRYIEYEFAFELFVLYEIIFVLYAYAKKLLFYMIVDILRKMLVVFCAKYISHAVLHFCSNSFCRKNVISNTHLHLAKLTLTDLECCNYFAYRQLLFSNVIWCSYMQMINFLVIIKRMHLSMK